MSQSELLKRVVDVLQAAGVEYMVTGSVVSSAQGHPRSTHDIDLVVNLPVTALPTLQAVFPRPYYHFDEEAASEAIARRDMFNVLEIDTGDKVDFWILKDHPYDRQRFARRESWDLGGVSAFVSPPDDTILQKLHWSELSGGSEKQFNDAKAVYELQYKRLDPGYMEEWAAKLDVVSLFERLKREAEPLV